MCVSHEENAGQNHSVKICNVPSESLAKFTYLGTNLTNQHCIRE